MDCYSYFVRFQLSSYHKIASISVNLRASYLYAVLFGYKGVVQILALLLAFRTCNVKVKGLDNSVYIAASVYVTSRPCGLCSTFILFFFSFTPQNFTYFSFQVSYFSFYFTNISFSSCFYQHFLTIIPVTMTYSYTADAKGVFGYTPLHEALASGHHKFLNYLYNLRLHSKN